MNLSDYGWDSHFDKEYEKYKDENLIPARITADFGQAVRVVTCESEFQVRRHVKDERAYGVGDFILLGYDEANKVYSIKELLPRKTKFSRVASGAVLKEQIVAANIDTVFIMQALNHDFNIKRLERYLISAWESGAMPVVVLTKKDLAEDADGMESQVYAAAAGVDVHSVSAVTNEGIGGIKKYFKKGRTVAFLGSSGVGKSTLVNVLAGSELLKTQEVLRDDDRGRHTTTHRQLVLLPEGGLVMDTPGMRTMGVWESGEGIGNMYGDIEELAANCRFNDCRHESEPGCAVKEALDNGTLSAMHWENYKKLQKELAHLERKKNQKLRMEEKNFSKMIKSSKKTVW